ncbi:MAG: hypothetical protein IJN90_03690 [Bacilli bacterium]|nr:hypothetical protein [Bacilli bacterium]
MYSDEEEKRGFPIRDFLLKLVLIIIFVLLLMWLLPTNKGSEVDLSPLTDRIFNANIQEMKEAAIPYFTTERLPKKVGDEAKLTLQQMLDLKLLLPFTDKNGDTCDTKNSYVSVTKEETEYLMKVYLKCNDDEDYILVHIGCYSYCTTENGVCEKEGDSTPTTTKPTTTTTTTVNGPSCVLEIASGTKGSNGWYVGNVKVRFKEKKTTASGATITSYGIGTSTVANYNKNTAYTVSKDGTTKVYGYVKDSNGKTAVCTISVKKDTVAPNCNVTVLSGSKNANGNYVGTVKVGFSSKTDATSGVQAYGMDVTSTANYNSKASYSVSKVGTTKVYGYVKDKAGHTKVCSTSVTIEEPKGIVSKPSCELQVSAGTLGDNNWYRSNVEISFKAKASTNGATITNFGLGTSENYNKATKYTVSTDGTHVIKGYVKDSNGYTATCSITIKRDATKPSCALSVTSGTKASDGSYTSNITIGFKSKTDATSGMSTYGIGKTTTYAKNTSYTITTAGQHTVYGYVKDKAGNTNICSIKVTKKSPTYEYQYSKDFATTYGSWSNWVTKEYDCKNPPSFKNTNTVQYEDLGSSKQISGYTYAIGKSITATQVKETGKVTEKSCTGWTYYRTSTTSTKTYAIKVADDWNYVGMVSLSGTPTDTLSTKYVFVGMDWDRCGSTCTTTPYTTWKKYTRSVSTVTATDTITTGSSVSVKCSSYETKDTVLYTTYSTVVGYEKTRTINYETTCSYRTRNRSVVKEAYTDYKWSYYNDQALLNDGYKMTGNKRLTN